MTTLHRPDSPMDDMHQLLQRRIQGRDAELKDPERRMVLVSALAEETGIHPEFIDGYLEAEEDRESLLFEARTSRRLVAPS